MSGVSRDALEKGMGSHLFFGPHDPRFRLGCQYAGPRIAIALPHCDEWIGLVGVSKDGRRQHYGGCSAGSVDLRGMVLSKNHDYALVETHSSANRFGVRINGTAKEHGARRRYKTLYVLKRRQGVSTNIQRSIDSSHCPNCGAPESDVASHACPFCETALNDGAHD
jgi:hypothetical protein